MTLLFNRFYISVSAFESTSIVTIVDLLIVRTENFAKMLSPPFSLNGIRKTVE